MTLEETIASFPEELIERCCGCGSMLDAYEAGKRLAKVEDPCFVWQMTVLEFARLIHQRQHFSDGSEAIEASAAIEAKAVVYLLSNPEKLEEAVKYVMEQR